MRVQEAVDLGEPVDLLDYQRMDDAAFRWFYRRHMSDIRQEPVTAFAKKLRINSLSDAFNKKLSVFKDWKEDNEETIRGCLKHDLRFWKVKRIC